MRLTSFTDYSLRILIYAAAHDTQRVTIEAASDYFQISRAHVKKVVLTLTRAGILRSIRGRTGGFQLAMAPAKINLGAVIRVTEPDFGLFECFLADNACCISRPCRLPSIANDALSAFLAVFDQHSLADAQVRPDYFVTPMPVRPQPIRGPLI